MVQRCESLGALDFPNVMATPSDAASHMLVPLTHWHACLRGAPFIEDRPQMVAIMELDSIATS